MTFGYVITQIGGADPDIYAKYIRLGLPTIQQYGERTRYRGFGAGMHVCLGQMVAKNDMAVAYRLLSQRIKAPKVNGTPVSLPDSGNTGWIHLPIAFEKR